MASTGREDEAMQPTQPLPPKAHAKQPTQSTVFNPRGVPFLPNPRAHHPARRRLVVRVLRPPRWVAFLWFTSRSISRCVQSHCLFQQR